MAPEQLLGEPLDARADLYAVGVVLYECLTGRRPHDADSPMALVGLKLSQDPVPPHEVAPGVPVALSRVVVRVLARDREARPPSAAGAARGAGSRRRQRRRVSRPLVSPGRQVTRALARTAGSAPLSRLGCTLQIGSWVGRALGGCPTQEGGS
jgi:serine/threonine-protein kinase